ncbi:hypothetical protein FA95DRAFT_1367024 [Auriscalpium vulgare]|uniref:Uncharacterized protein n=1 Tax=Auriscalpium vulgare TaxID=40419 RepID=A0ACB8R1Z9_9AGAM|nr:hypothetical protein FA95DRAFT_1367024 [Auriscalpium vulgare]
MTVITVRSTGIAPITHASSTSRIEYGPRERADKDSCTECTHISCAGSNAERWRERATIRMRTIPLCEGLQQVYLYKARMSALRPRHPHTIHHTPHTTHPQRPLHHDAREATPHPARRHEYRAVDEAGLLLRGALPVGRRGHPGDPHLASGRGDQRQRHSGVLLVPVRASTRVRGTIDAQQRRLRPQGVLAGMRRHGAAESVPDAAVLTITVTNATATSGPSDTASTSPSAVLIYFTFPT